VPEEVFEGVKDGVGDAVLEGENVGVAV